MIANGLHEVPPGKVAMVVTHLEMVTQAPLRGVALPVELRFRQVTPDAGWFREVFDRVGRPWLWYGRRQISDAALEAILNDPNVSHYTLEKGGQDEALLELDFRSAGACELAYFGVSPALIGTGAGGYLMDRAIELAWAQPIRQFHVHTCTFDSPQALGFYRRSGFVPYKQQVEIDDDPRLGGLLPLETAPHVPMFAPDGIPPRT